MSPGYPWRAVHRRGRAAPSSAGAGCAHLAPWGVGEWEACAEKLAVFAKPAFAGFLAVTAKPETPAELADSPPLAAAAGRAEPAAAIAG